MNNDPIRRDRVSRLIKVGSRVAFTLQNTVALEIGYVDCFTKQLVRIKHNDRTYWKRPCNIVVI